MTGQTATNEKARRRMSLRRYVGELGIVGYVIRLAILLIFAIYFVVPLVWLLFATTRDPSNLYGNWFPLTFGSIDRLVTSWNNIGTHTIVAQREIVTFPVMLQCHAPIGCWTAET